MLGFKEAVRRRQNEIEEDRKNLIDEREAEHERIREEIENSRSTTEKVCEVCTSAFPFF